MAPPGLPAWQHLLIQSIPGAIRIEVRYDVPLTVEKIEAVQRTWALAAAMPDQTTQAFYSNLFRLDPTTKPLFVNDIERQGRKLAETLNFIVDHLDDLETLMPAARDLAIRHVPYGVEAGQYDSVGAALITTLKQLLGPAFTPEDEAAWADIYGALSTEMQASAYGL